MSHNLTAAFLNLIDHAVEYVQARREAGGMTRAEVAEFGCLADQIYDQALLAGIVQALPRVEEVRPQVECANLPPVRFETKLNLPGDWVNLSPPCPEEEDFLPVYVTLDTDPPEVSNHWVFLSCLPGGSRWLLDMAALRRVAEARISEPIRPVSAATVEALVEEGTLQVLEIARSNKTAEEKMREICRLDRRYLAWDSPKWAGFLLVSEGAIRKTTCWKEIRGQASDAE